MQLFQPRNFKTNSRTSPLQTIRQKRDPKREQELPNEQLRNQRKKKTSPTLTMISLASSFLIAPCFFYIHRPHLHDDKIKDSYGRAPASTTQAGTDLQISNDDPAGKPLKSGIPKITFQEILRKIASSVKTKNPQLPDTTTPTANAGAERREKKAEEFQNLIKSMGYTQPPDDTPTELLKNLCDQGWAVGCDMARYKVQKHLTHLEISIDETISNNLPPEDSQIAEMEILRAEISVLNQLACKNDFPGDCTNALIDLKGTPQGVALDKKLRQNCQDGDADYCSAIANYARLEAFELTSSDELSPEIRDENLHLLTSLCETSEHDCAALLRPAYFDWDSPETRLALDKASDACFGPDSSEFEQTHWTVCIELANALQRNDANPSP
jgi:hypothetical protein